MRQGTRRRSDAERGRAGQAPDSLCKAQVGKGASGKMRNYTRWIERAPAELTFRPLAYLSWIERGCAQLSFGRLLIWPAYPLTRLPNLRILRSRLGDAGTRRGVAVSPRRPPPLAPRRVASLSVAVDNPAPVRSNIDPSKNSWITS